ncbi:BTB/POZ domain-containing protein DOT3-like [Durio zibethinus]|uniref:BTB/POZ domain-containing protein DOT3-like n=1 Tax=Durio zibethinus TaxID=66656 RepID=A0A6P6BCY6_DURZI|nr:BTB/POZ domain-containing protein DOT3-like [Durio zibethinus]
MKKSFQMAHPRSPGGSDADGNDHQVYDQSIIIPNKLITAADGLERKELSWFATSQIPTDLAIQVQGVIFNVHKYPLIAKCGYIGRLELQPSISNFGRDLKLENFPGGSETFEMILKFCYGLPLDLNPNNIASLRCASEYLEMTEEFEDGNLIAKTEAFLTFVVLASWKDTITVLKSCETLFPWAESLQIVRRCCDSIAHKISRENASTGEIVSEESWWFDDVATLHIHHFMRIMTAIRAKGTKAEIVGKCIMNYADKWLPYMDEELEGLRGYGYGKSELQFIILRREEEESSAQNKEQRTIIENLVSILPSQYEAVSCKFLLQMLKTAMVYSASPALISDLEKRIGMMLEDANVNDLLIPNYKNEDQGIMVNSPEQRTMHNIDVVQRILDYFLLHEQQQQQQQMGKTNVSKLLDNYLAEIARDPNLSITKFQVLAESLPENARSCDDGLYRAMDIYLKTHPSLSEHDRRRLCKIMNCEKLSFDACMHAAQNDRLPLQTVVQILFSEQAKMRMAMQGKEPLTRGDNSEQEEHRPSTNTEIKDLKSELENVKTKMSELQNDYSDLQQEYERICNKQKNASGWSLNWRKIKNSFHVKAESDDTGDGQNRSNPAGFRLSFRRRRSLS